MDLYLEFFVDEHIVNMGIESENNGGLNCYEKKKLL